MSAIQCRHIRQRARPMSTFSGRAPRRGFTIVSMMVAMILLAVGLSSLAGANAQTITMQTLAQNRTSAIAIARAYLDRSSV